MNAGQFHYVYSERMEWARMFQRTNRWESRFTACITNIQRLVGIWRTKLYVVGPISTATALAELKARADHMHLELVFVDALQVLEAPK